MNLGPQSDAAYTLHDGQAAASLALASKAMLDGKFEKATAYALIALAHQAERDNVVRVAKGGWAS